LLRLRAAADPASGAARRRERRDTTPAGKVKTGKTMVVSWFECLPRVAERRLRERRQAMNRR
jgi:hypothetical protein